MILNLLLGTPYTWSSQRYRPIGESNRLLWWNNLNGSSCWGTESNINIEGGPYGAHEYCSKAFERVGYMLLEKAKTIMLGTSTRVLWLEHTPLQKEKRKNIHRKKH